MAEVERAAAEEERAETDREDCEEAEGEETADSEAEAEADLLFLIAAERTDSMKTLTWWAAGEPGGRRMACWKHFSAESFGEEEGRCRARIFRRKMLILIVHPCCIAY